MERHHQGLILLALVLIVSTTAHIVLDSSCDAAPICTNNANCTAGQCCLRHTGDDPAAVCAPRATLLQPCSSSFTLRFRGGPLQEPLVFTEFCPCTGRLQCVTVDNTTGKGFCGYSPTV